MTDPSLEPKTPAAPSDTSLLARARNWAERLGLPDNRWFAPPLPVAEQRTFHEEEYRQLRQEILSLLDRIQNLFRYSLIVSATVYAWLTATAFGLAGVGADRACLKIPRAILLVGWWIPPAFVVLAALLAASSFWRVYVMGTYLQRIERTLGCERLGWESFNRSTRPVMTRSAIVVWTLLLIATLIATVVAVWITVHAMTACVPAEEPKP